MPAQGIAVAPDSLRAILDSVFAGEAYRWVERPDPWAPVRRAWLSLLDWLARLERENPGAYKLLLWALVAILGVILIHGLVVLWRMARTSVAEGEAAAPLPPPRDARWYRAEAERLAAAGEYRRAMQAEFSAVVLTLASPPAIRTCERYWCHRSQHRYRSYEPRDAACRDRRRGSLSAPRGDTTPARDALNCHW